MPLGFVAIVYQPHPASEALSQIPDCFAPKSKEATARRELVEAAYKEIEDSAKQASESPGCGLTNVYSLPVQVSRLDLAGLTSDADEIVPFMSLALTSPGLKIATCFRP